MSTEQEQITHLKENIMTMQRDNDETMKQIEEDARSEILEI